MILGKIVKGRVVLPVSLCLAQTTDLAIDFVVDVETILVNKFPQLSFEEVRQMLDLKEVNFSETQFYKDVLQKGLEQGLEQGVQREVDLVLRLLQRRCGTISVDRQELVRSLTIAQLEALGDALLDFNGMADLEVWFAVNLSPNDR